MDDRPTRLLRPVAGLSTPAWALLAVSIIAGSCFPLIDGRSGAVLDIVAKAAGVAALAIAAALTPGQRWLAAIMAAGALGDVLLEVTAGPVAGGAAFAAGHVIAIIYYSRHRRRLLRPLDWLLAAALVAYGLVMPSLVLPDGADAAAVTLYAALLCTMAAAASLSRFPRSLVAVGALLFVASDTLLIMRMAGRTVGTPALHGLFVWYLYYFGQLAIFTGVIGRRPRR